MFGVSPSVWRALFVVVVTFVLACGDPLLTASEPPTSPNQPSDDAGAVDAGAVDTGAVDGGLSPDTDSGGLDNPPAATLAVAPATATTIVSGATVLLTATLTNAADAVAWTLAGPGSLSSATGPSTTYTPPAKGPIGVAVVTATAGALSATSSVLVNLPPKESVVAYAWAHSISAASYTPLADYSYNASGGEVSASRSGVGVYTMTFSGLDLEAGNVQVTSVSDDGRCNIHGREESSVSVRCFDWSGAPVDAEYMVSIVLDHTVSAASIIGYASVDSASVAPDALSYNAHLGGVVATRLGTGISRISFAGLSRFGNIQVSARDGDKTCNVSGWSNGEIFVRCYDTAGELSNSPYTVIAYGTNRMSTANVAAYAWAERPAVASYTPSAQYSYNSGGGAIAATRSAAGAYAISFAGLDLSGGAVKVSAYGTGHYCNVPSFSGTTVDVRCYDVAGTPSDTRYTISVILNNHPLLSSVAGYAWADQPTSASYTPDTAHSYNAAGGGITVTRSAVGRYTMNFGDLSTGGANVEITPFGANVTCSAITTIAYGNPVDIRCHDSSGAFVDSMYVVTLFGSFVPSLASTVAYAWADKPAAPTYSPDAARSYNATGGAITATRSNVGTYQIAFDGLQLDRGAVEVGGYGGSVNCVLGRWEDEKVAVDCFDRNGARADSQYTVSVLKVGIPSRAVSLAYAEPFNASSASYVPVPSYNAAVQETKATRSAVGTYALTFPGLNLDRGHVKVSASDSAALCNVGSWSGDTIHVRCFDTQGTLVDSPYTARYTQ